MCLITGSNPFSVGFTYPSSRLSDPSEWAEWGLQQDHLGLLDRNVSLAEVASSFGTAWRVSSGDSGDNKRVEVTAGAA